MTAKVFLGVDVPIARHLSSVSIIWVELEVKVAFREYDQKEQIRRLSSGESWNAGHG